MCLVNTCAESLGVRDALALCLAAWSLAASDDNADPLADRALAAAIARAVTAHTSHVSGILPGRVQKNLRKKTTGTELGT